MGPDRIERQQQHVRKFCRFLPILCNFFSLRLFFCKISVEVAAAPFEEVLKFDISIIGRCSNEELFLSKIMDWEVPEIATYYASELWLKSFFFLDRVWSMLLFKIALKVFVHLKYIIIVAALVAALFNQLGNSMYLY